MSVVKELSELIDLIEAAKLSGLARATWANGGAGTRVVPRVRFGRSIRVRRSDVDRFIAERIKQAERDITRLRDFAM